MQSSSANGTFKKRILWGLSAILLIAALTRFVDLAHKSFWIDEGTTAFEVRGDLVSFLHPPGFFALERPVIQLLGESDYTFRLLPAVCGWLTVLFIFLIALQLLAGQTYRVAGAFVAGLTAAINPYMVAASQENRMYGLIMFIAASSTFFLLKALRAYQEYGDSALKRAWGWWLAYIVVISYGSYTHVFTFTLLLMGNLYVLWQMARHSLRFKFWHYLGAQAIIITAYLPLLPLTSKHVVERKAAVLLTFSNLGLFYYFKSLGRAIFRYAFGFLLSIPGERFTDVLKATPALGLYYLVFIIITSIGIGLACWGLITLNRKKLPTHPLVFGLLFVIGLLLVALTIDNANPRQLTLAAPFFFVMMGSGVALLRRKWLILAVICLWAGNLALYVPYVKADTLPYSSPRWRYIAAYLNENVPPDEAVVVTYGGRDGYYTLKYYQCKCNLFFARRPTTGEKMPLIAREIAGEPVKSIKSDAALAAELFGTNQYRRIWFVRSRFSFNPTDLAKNFAVREITGHFGSEVEILVVEKPSGVAAPVTGSQPASESQTRP